MIETKIITASQLARLSLALTNECPYMPKDDEIIIGWNSLGGRHISGGEKKVLKHPEFRELGFVTCRDPEHVVWGPTKGGDSLVAHRMQEGYLLTLISSDRQERWVNAFHGQPSAHRAVFFQVDENPEGFKTGYCWAFKCAQSREQADADAKRLADATLLPAVAVQEGDEFVEVHEE